MPPASRLFIKFRHVIVNTLFTSCVKHNMKYIYLMNNHLIVIHCEVFFFVNVKLSKYGDKKEN